MLWIFPLLLLIVVGCALWHVNRVNQQTAAENRRLTNENARLRSEKVEVNRLKRSDFACGCDGSCGCDGACQSWGSCPICENPDPEVLVTSDSGAVQGCDQCVGCTACLTGWCVLHGADEPFIEAVVIEAEPEAEPEPSVVTRRALTTAADRGDVSCDPASGDEAEPEPSMVIEEGVQ